LRELSPSFFCGLPQKKHVSITNRLPPHGLSYAVNANSARRRLQTTPWLKQASTLAISAYTVIPYFFYFFFAVKILLISSKKPLSAQGIAAEILLAQPKD
jgi:hypothetical protein